MLIFSNINNHQGCDLSRTHFKNVLCPHHIPLHPLPCFTYVPLTILETLKFSWEKIVHGNTSVLSKLLKEVYPLQWQMLAT